MDGQWLTYEEAGVRLGVTPEAARRRAIRGKWARMAGNDGHANHPHLPAAEPLAQRLEHADLVVDAVDAPDGLGGEREQSASTRVTKKPGGLLTYPPDTRATPPSRDGTGASRTTAPARRETPGLTSPLPVSAKPSGPSR